MTLNQKIGERAVLIKNNGGDWGIVSGYWKGMKKGVAGTRRKLLKYLLDCHIYLTFVLPTILFSCTVLHVSSLYSDRVLEFHVGLCTVHKLVHDINTAAATSLPLVINNKMMLIP